MLASLFFFSLKQFVILFLFFFKNLLSSAIPQPLHCDSCRPGVQAADVQVAVWSCQEGHPV